MRFSTITLIISAATATNAAVLPDFERTAVASNEFQVTGEILDSPLEKRVIIEGILTTIATTALTELTTQGVKAGIQLVKDIASFDSARQAFTKETVAKMAAANTDSVNFPAAICYNQGYTLEDPAGFTGLVSVELKQGLLHVDFDCMYMSKANAFFTEGDGGFQNLATESTNDCTFDSKTADLRCN